MEEQEGTQIEPEGKENSETQLDLPELPKTPPPALANYIPTEVSLEHLGFFTPSSKRIKNIYTKEKILKTLTNEDGTKRIIKVHISANHELGLPITSDLDYYRAFLKILDETAGPDGRVHLPIHVPTRKLIRYAGKKEMARTWKEAREYLKRMTLTGIEGGIYLKKREDYDDAFVGTLFSQVILRGQQIRNGKTADTNLVWLAPWFLSNYYHRHRRSTDHNLYKRLRKPISKSLLSLLETGWYASQGNPYAKSYRDLCRDFLLRQEKHLSDIKKQLDPAHQELKRENFLEGWRYHPTKDKRDWILTYYPGRKFFDDQKYRLGRKQLSQPEEPPLTPDQEFTLEEIQTITGEHENPYWFEIIKTYPLALISMALAETHQADLEHNITKNRGAYFIDILKHLHQARKNHSPINRPPPLSFT